jgi:hypothetical protein
MSLAGNVLCGLGRHDRSRGRAKRSGGTWVSRCRRCGAPMRRLYTGKWVPIAPEQPATQEEEIALASTEVFRPEEPISGDPESAAFPDFAEPMPEPAHLRPPSVFRRTMRYLWYGRG